MNNNQNNSHILAIDQGTTSTRSIVFDSTLKPLSTAQVELTQYFPQSGWVEHDPEEIWSTTLDMCKQAIDSAQLTAKDIAAIGITNQRETTIVWDKNTGQAIYNAIVWQDRRTAEYCHSLNEQGYEKTINAATGLLIDPYFSATKLRWILENVDGARAKAEAGELLFGTVDCFLMWRLTAKKVHATDATNAARTMLYNIVDGCWDENILSLLNIPACLLPEVRNNSDDFGHTDSAIFDGTAVPIRGVAGDQQAATVGQACFQVGMIKSTYGTGCFALLNTGAEPVFSKNRLLTTIAYQLDGTVAYALEGSIFVAGAVVQWLRDGLQIINNASETQSLAEQSKDTERVYCVPAFTGLGAPYWNAECRGAIFGLTRDTGRNEIVRAALESVAYQTRDLIEAMNSDWNSQSQTVLRVDGGLSNNDWAMQNLADQLGAAVDRPRITETTALGVAYLAGLAIGMFPPPTEFAAQWSLQKRFQPKLASNLADERYAGWRKSVESVLHQSS